MCGGTDLSSTPPGDRSGLLFPTHQEGEPEGSHSEFQCLKFLDVKFHARSMPQKVSPIQKSDPLSNARLSSPPPPG